MVLSRFELDIGKRTTMRALASPNLFHGAIEASFPGERERRLWRIDSLNGSLWLLLLSQTAPADPAVEQFGMPGARWETKNYDPFLSRLSTGTIWHFRLTANPTISKKTGDPEARGVVMPHITPKYQKAWLEERAEKHGFALNNDSFDVVSVQRYRFRKGTDRQFVRMISVSYEGVLEVTDPDLLRNALISGIGREKAYGQGMLTLVPMK